MADTWQMNKLWKKLKSGPTLDKRIKYESCALDVKAAVKESALNYESNIIYSNNIASIYKHINSRLTHKTGIAPLRDFTDNIVADDLSKAELLNAHFISVGTVDDGNIPTLEKYSTQYQYLNWSINLKVLA